MLKENDWRSLFICDHEIGEGDAEHVKPRVPHRTSDN